MANINEILARAAALRDETALNSISPERAGGIMYDTLLALNELWLQQGAALVISKIYASVAAMEADTAPVSDLTGKPLRPGQIVVIASSDSDNGSVYRYNGTESPSWTLVGSIGNLDPVDSLDSDSTTLPLAAHQGKVLDSKISQLGQEVNGLEGLDIDDTYSAFEYIPIDTPVEAGRVIYNRSNYIVYVYSGNTELAQINALSSQSYNVSVTKFRASATAGRYIIHVDGTQSLQDQINAKVSDVVDNHLYGRKHGEWKVISLDDIDMKDTHSIYGECVNIVRDVWVREDIGNKVEEATNYHLFVYLLKAGKHYIFSPSSHNVLPSVQSIVYRFSIGANATPSAGDSIIKGQIKQLCSVNEIIEYTPASDQYLWVQYYYGICCDCYEYEDKNISIILKERTRKVVNILNTDTEVEIFDKMLNAYYTGNIDIVFEKGTYEFSSVYPYMYDRVKFTGHYEGLPIGNNCRYYFNGSTLISNAPSAEYSGLRNILDTCGEGSNFEVYDVTLINNGGHYCIHDEVTSSTNAYRHIYKNVKMKYVTTQDTEFGDKPFGCGTGFDGFISLENCFILSDYTQDNTFAVHGATYNPSSNPQNLTIELKGCYFGAGMLQLNTTYYDATRDNIVLVVSNCKLQNNLDADSSALAKELYVWGNELVNP